MIFVLVTWQQASKYIFYLYLQIWKNSNETDSDVSKNKFNKEMKPEFNWVIDCSLS